MFCDHNLFIDKNTNTMKQKIRLTESQLHNIIRKCVNEVAVQGKSGKTYSLHGNDAGDWSRLAFARGYKSQNDKTNPHYRKRNRNVKNANNILDKVGRDKFTEDDVLSWIDDGYDIAANMKNESRRSRMNRIIKESVRKVLKEDDMSTKNEVERLVKRLGSSIDEWLSPTEFCDKHGCGGYIFNSEEEAYDSIINGDEHQNAVDYVDGAITDEEWVSYLVGGGIDEQTAQGIIANGDWDAVVGIIVDKEGPEWFLSQYSGRKYYLEDGQILYY